MVGASEGVLEDTSGVGSTVEETADEVSGEGSMEGETEGSNEGDGEGDGETEGEGDGDGDTEGEGETLPAIWSEPPLQVRGILSVVYQPLAVSKQLGPASRPLALQ